MKAPPSSEINTKKKLNKWVKDCGLEDKRHNQVHNNPAFQGLKKCKWSELLSKKKEDFSAMPGDLGNSLFDFIHAEGNKNDCT